MALEHEEVRRCFLLLKRLGITKLELEERAFNDLYFAITENAKEYIYPEIHSPYHLTEMTYLGVRISKN